MSYVPPALRAHGSAASMRRGTPPGARRDVPPHTGAADTPPLGGTPPPSGELEGCLPSIRQPFGPPAAGQAGFASGRERQPAAPTPEQVAGFKESFQKRQEMRAAMLSKIAQAAGQAANSNKNKAEKEGKAKAKAKEKVARESLAPPVKFPNNSTLVFFRNIVETPSGELQPSPWSWWRSDNGGRKMFGLAFLAAREDTTEDQFMAVWKPARKEELQAELQHNRPHRKELEHTASGVPESHKLPERRSGQIDAVVQGSSAAADTDPHMELARLFSEAQLEAQLVAETQEMRMRYRVWQQVRQKGIEEHKPALLLLCNLWDHGHQPLFINSPPPALKPNQSAATSRAWGEFKGYRDFVWRPMRGLQGIDAAAVDEARIGFGSRDDDGGMVRMVDDPLAEASAGEFWVKSFAHSLLPLAFQVPWSLARRRMELTLSEQLPRGAVHPGKLNEMRRKLDEFVQVHRGHPFIHLADEMFTRTWYFNNTQNDAEVLGIPEGALNFNRPIPFVGQQISYQNNNAGPNQSNNTKGQGTFLGWFRLTSVKFVAPGSNELQRMQGLRFGRRGKPERSDYGIEPFWARFGVAQIPEWRWPDPYSQPGEQRGEVDIMPPSAGEELSREGESGEPREEQGKPSRKNARGHITLMPLKAFKSLAECEGYEMFIAGLLSPVRKEKNKQGVQSDSPADQENRPANTPNERVLRVSGKFEPSMQE